MCFSFLSILCKKNLLSKKVWEGGGTIAPSVPPLSVVGPVMSDELKDVSCDYVFWIFFRESMAVLSFMFAGYMRQILGWGTFLA